MVAESIYELSVECNLISSLFLKFWTNSLFAYISMTDSMWAHDEFEGQIIIRSHFFSIGEYVFVVHASS